MDRGVAGGADRRSDPHVSLRTLRDDYDTDGLEASDLGGSPLAAVAAWIRDAVEAGIPQPNAMAVATVGADGAPSLRTVLLKDVDHGLVFYTNLLSRKGRELTNDPRAAASLTWITLHRQIRVEGRVEQVAAATADAYFASRPEGARIAAVASPQSEEIPDRTWLERRVEAVAAEHGGAPPRPPHWSGLRIVPHVVEFWQGRRDRLHDRIVYRRNGDHWTTRRLAP